MTSLSQATIPTFPRRKRREKSASSERGSPFIGIDAKRPQFAV
jgi:hypothetical protein